MLKDFWLIPSTTFILLISIFLAILPVFLLNMPLGVKPCCATCKTADSPMWRKHKKGYIQCNSCGLKDLPPANDSANGNGSSTAQGKNGNQQSGNGGKGREGTRKSSRNVKKLRYKQMVTAAPKHPSTKGKGRRIIFKRNVSL